MRRAFTAVTDDLFPFSSAVSALTVYSYDSLEPLAEESFKIYRTDWN